MADDIMLAKRVRGCVNVLNEAIKEATAAGLDIKVEEVRYDTTLIGERACQRFDVYVARPL